MQTIINAIVMHCIANGYVSEQQAPWLKYGLEKRLTGLLVTVPFLLFGFFLSNIPTTIAYYVGFRFLRSRTNGLHAKTVLGCFLASMLCELVFLGFISPALNLGITHTLLLIAFIIIFKLAPFRHPSMNLSQEEVFACAKGSKIRTSILLALYFISLFFGFLRIVSNTGMLHLLSARHALCTLGIPLSPCAEAHSLICFQFHYCSSEESPSPNAFRAAVNAFCVLTARLFSVAINERISATPKAPSDGAK